MPLRNFANRSNSCVARSLCDSWAICQASQAAPLYSYFLIFQKESLVPVDILFGNRQCTLLCIASCLPCSNTVMAVLIGKLHWKSISIWQS